MLILQNRPYSCQHMLVTVPDHESSNKAPSLTYTNRRHWYQKFPVFITTCSSNILWDTKRDAKEVQKAEIGSGKAQGRSTSIGQVGGKERVPWGFLGQVLKSPPPVAPLRLPPSYPSSLSLPISWNLFFRPFLYRLLQSLPSSTGVIPRPRVYGRTRELRSFFHRHLEVARMQFLFLERERSRWRSKDARGARLRW